MCFHIVINQPYSLQCYALEPLWDRKSFVDHPGIHRPFYIVSVKINVWKKIFFQVPYTLINIHLIFLLIYDVGTVVIPFFRWGNQGPEKSSQDRTPICLTSHHPSSPRPAPSTFHGRLPSMRWVPALHPRKTCRLHVLALSLGIQVD